MAGSPRFKKILLIRFLGYFFVQVGLITLLLVVEPVFNEELKFRVNQLFGRQHIVPRVITSVNPDGSAVPDESQRQGSGFADLVFGSSEVISPVSVTYGIVIEKIGANAKVVADVDPGSEQAYTQALAEGVAHAKGTAYPGQNGNVYLFSHSVDAPWNVVRYNAIFYLLNKLEPGDRIIMYYQGRRFDYTVFDKRVVTPQETQYLTNVYQEPILTLQTCDPPGTLINRLIVRAKLAGN